MFARWACAVVFGLMMLTASSALATEVVDSRSVNVVHVSDYGADTTSDQTMPAAGVSSADRLLCSTEPTGRPPIAAVVILLLGAVVMLRRLTRMS